MLRRGRKSAAQTPAPKSERIYGSKKNKKGSAASKKSGSTIKLNDKIVKSLTEKAREYNENHSGKVTVPTLKAVYRRGLGAYSSSHRPTITGGVPNSRNAWAMARVNKFLLKKSGKKVKAAYVQDDDLMAKGGEVKDTEIPKYLYHSTPSSNYKLIKQNGLSVGFDGRIYLTKTLGAADDIANQLHQAYKDEQENIKFYHIWRIDTTKLPSNIVFYVDDDYDAGIYIKQPIPKNAIKHYETTKVEYAKGGKVFNDKELLAKYKRGESIGFTGIAHLKAKGLIERADGTKRKSYARGGKFKATGDCYYIAGQFAMNNLFTPKKIDYIGTPYLVHAEVQGQGRLENIRYGHAWIEDDIFVYDFSNNRELKIPKDFYYSLGNVDTTNPVKYRKYTFEEARRKMVDTGNYGCWDLEVEYADGGKVDDGKANFGKPPIPYDQIPFIHEAEKQNVEDILKNGFKIGTNPYITTGVYTIPIVYKQNKFDETNRTQELAIYLKKGSKIFWTNSERPTDYYRGYGNKFYEKLYSHLNSGHKTPRDDWNNKETQRDFCRRMEKWLFENGYVGVQQGGEIVITDLNAIQDIDIFDRYANGGEVDNYIFCENCGWNWKESETTEDDKYICHKCQHDNETSYIMSKLKKPKTITELSVIHNVPEQELESQLQKGIKTEMEHTTDKKIAETIALHHIEEMPDYYDKLQEMENPIVKLYSKSTKELKDGGVVVGKRHSESDENGSGEKFLVKSTGQVVELEGGEGVLCKNSMESDRKFTFENRTMTGREIASFLNHKYGGVEFAKGGEVNHVCGCKMFYHGGELPSATVEELEGGEAVITVKTMESKDKYNFNGTKMTPRKILSQINGLSGGKKFDEGGVIDLRKHKMENEKTLTKMVYFTEKILYSK